MDHDPSLTPKSPELLDLPFEEQIEHLARLVKLGNFMEAASTIAHQLPTEVLGDFLEVVQFPKKSGLPYGSVELARSDHDIAMAYGIGVGTAGHKNVTAFYSPDESDAVRWEVEVTRPDATPVVTPNATLSQKDEGIFRQRIIEALIELQKRRKTTRKTITVESPYL